MILSTTWCLFSRNVSTIELKHLDRSKFIQNIDLMRLQMLLYNKQAIIRVDITYIILVWVSYVWDDSNLKRTFKYSS